MPETPKETLPDIQRKHVTNLRGVVDVYFDNDEKEKYTDMLERAEGLIEKDFHQVDQLLQIVGLAVTRVVNQK